MPGTEVKTGGSLTRTCAFCGGTGKDPFELLSKLSNCQVCGGRGNVSLAQPAIKCGYCGGTGIHRDQRLTCVVCGGKGMVTVEKGSQTCPDCNGRSVVEGDYLPCARCGGTGVTAKRAAAPQAKAKKEPSSEKQKTGRS